MSIISSTDQELVNQARQFSEVLAENSKARQFLEALCQRVEALEADIVVMNSVTSRMSGPAVDIKELEARFNAFEQKINPILMDLPMQIREIVRNMRGA